MGWLSAPNRYEGRATAALIVAPTLLEVLTTRMKSVRFVLVESLSPYTQGSRASNLNKVLLSSATTTPSDPPTALQQCGRHLATEEVRRRSWAAPSGQNEVKGPERERRVAARRGGPRRECRPHRAA